MSGAGAVGAELIAVLVAVTAGTPRVLTIEGGRALPSGPFALEHRSLQSGLRAWVEEQTRHPLGYVEQLYTFADRDRGGEGERRVSISYLGLTREIRLDGEPEVGWRDWYGRFPHEDHRAGPPSAIPDVIAPALAAWADAAPDAPSRHRLRAALQPVPAHEAHHARQHPARAGNHDDRGRDRPAVAAPARLAVERMLAIR